MTDTYTIVTCITEPTDEQRNCGYDGPGWYFYDSDSLHGPFETYEEAKALRFYCLGNGNCRCWKEV